MRLIKNGVDGMKTCFGTVNEGNIHAADRRTIPKTGPVKDGPAVLNKAT